MVLLLAGEVIFMGVDSRTKLAEGVFVIQASGCQRDDQMHIGAVVFHSGKR